MRLAPRCFGLLLLLLCSGCFDAIKTKEVEVGFQGLAKRNPFLGAQLLAEELGFEGQGTLRLSKLPPTDWVLLIRDGVLLGGEPQAYDLLEWVEQGGSLWIALGDEVDWIGPDEGDEDYDDNTYEEDPYEAGGEPVYGPADWALFALLDELELDVVENSANVEATLFSAPELELPWPESEVVLGDSQDRGFEYWGDYEEAALIRMPWGEGSVHFFASLSGFDNHHLPEKNWAELFQHLLESPKRVQGVLVVYGGGSSFFALLWQHAWFFLVALFLLTVVWLWRVSGRFGPAQEDPAWDPEGMGVGRGREFVEHIRAAGRTYGRRGQRDLLLKAASEHASQNEGSQGRTPEVLPGGATDFVHKMKAIQRSARSGAASVLSHHPEQDRSSKT